jgi:phosphoesterase RecJ-like protein
MTYRTPDARLGPVQEILEALDRAERLVLTTHVNADGDGAGSQMALAGWLRARGKPTWIINPTPFPPSLAFLLPDGDWTLDVGSKRAVEVVRDADLAVVLDTGELPRIGPVSELIQGLPTVVLDHHPPGPEPIPGLALRDPGACATGELVFDLLLAAGTPWPEWSVNGLYVALLADTGSFRFSNTTPDALRIAADLVERGADPERLHRYVFGNLPLRKLRLLAASLAELRVDSEETVAWMTVPADAFAELDARADDIEGLVDYPRDIEGIEVALLFRETVKGATKVSFRSNGNVDVNALARRFGGGGHVKASGALVDKPLVEVREEVLTVTRAAVANAAAVEASVRGREEDDGG